MHIICQTKTAWGYKKGTTKQSRSNESITGKRTRTDIKLQPSRLECYHDQFIKTTSKNKN